MSTTYYYSAGGEMFGEHTLGQSRLDYIPDALGSVTATVDQSLTVQSTARYKPYGADLATTGTVPKFGWVGTLGYRRTGNTHADIYVRARTYGSAEGMWTSVDPLWPTESAYGYVAGRPVSRSDYYGLQLAGGQGGVAEPIPELPDWEFDDVEISPQHRHLEPKSIYLIDNDNFQILYGACDIIQRLGRGLASVAQAAVPVPPRIKRPTRVPKTNDCQELLLWVHKKGGRGALCDEKQTCDKSIWTQPGVSDADACEEILRRLYNARDCYRIRKAIRENCPPPQRDSNNKNHDDQTKGALNNYKKCFDTFKKRGCKRFYG